MSYMGRILKTAKQLNVWSYMTLVDRTLAALSKRQLGKARLDENFLQVIAQSLASEYQNCPTIICPYKCWLSLGNLPLAQLSTLVNDALQLAPP